MVPTKRASGMKTAGFSRLLLSCALVAGAALSAAPARAGLLNDMWSDKPADSAAPEDDGKPPKALFNRLFDKDDPAPAPVAQPPQAAAPNVGKSGASKRAAQAATPVEAVPSAQPSGQAIKPPTAVEEPGMFGRAMNSIGLDSQPVSNKIDYSERPKIVVPAQRDLPPPREGAQRQPTAHPDERALVNPPPEYLEKMRGADGQVSGVKEGDIPKEKKFFGMF